MNERIKKLAKKAEINLTPAQFSGVLEDEVDEFTLEKFAELIVRECAGIALKDATPEWDWTEANTQSKKIAVDIKQHFGLKE